MKVTLHKLFEIFLHAQQAGFDYSLTSSLRRSPKLGEFLADLDPELPLDWSEKSFYGLPELRQRIIETQGYDVSIDDVLVTAGTNEANFLAITQIVSAGDDVVIDQPGWPQATVLCNALGANITYIRRREDDGWRIDLEEFDRLVTPRTKLIFLNGPNNPTGAVFTDEDMRRLCEIAEKNDAYLISDEVYRGLEWEGPRSPAAVNYYDKAITTASVSKCLGLQGLRTGWMASRDKDILFKALVLREDTSEIMNVMGEYISWAALEPRRYEALIAAALEDGRRCWPIIEEWVNGRDWLEWVKPQAGYLCFVKYHLDISSDDFHKRLLAPPYRTLVHPGTAYNIEHHIRLGIGGGDDDKIRRGLERIDQFVADLMKAG